MFPLTAPSWAHTCLVAPLAVPCFDISDIPATRVMISLQAGGLGMGLWGPGGDNGAHPEKSWSEPELLAQLRTEPHPTGLGWPMAWYKREFLALPIMGAGMTATLMTPGLGTRVSDPSGQAGRQTGRLAEGLPGSPPPAWLPRRHGPGSQAPCTQGQEGLGILCLCLCGDCQALGHRPPRHSPKPRSLASPRASGSPRGEFPGQAGPLPGGQAGHRQGPLPGRWFP